VNTITLRSCRPADTTVHLSFRRDGQKISPGLRKEHGPVVNGGDSARIEQKPAFEAIFKFGLRLAVVILCMACVTSLHADILAVGGTINQATQDGTGPAVNNPTLNAIMDGASYTAVFDFTGSVLSPGTYNLTGSSVLLSVAGIGPIESQFGFVSLTDARSGSFAQFSILACLATGSGCNQGNELDLNFMIPLGNLSDQNVAAQAISGLLPFDLLEDDGATDIQGVVTSYSYTSASPIPEPSAFLLLGSSLVGIRLIRVKRRP
jgi:hypothetical protein